ncbi:MAG: redox-sensing transcriptional repressor Rex [Actinomycetia bacterium]|nr:redox-sensing transcriptional repressor Rex [Actinomycetes bacterium]
MPAPTHVPHTTIQRLPVYLRCLLQAQAARVRVISSGDIAEMCGTNPAQVRKDLSYLGELGTRGIGYDVDDLVGHISEVLGITERRKVALVGFGKLGAALYGYSGFAERGFEFVAIVDVDPAKVGTQTDGITIRHLDDACEVVRASGAEIAIISTPADGAQAAADVVVEAGVKAILNLAPVRLVVPPDVAVRQVCLSTDLQILSFYLAQHDGGER